MNIISISSGVSLFAMSLLATTSPDVDASNNRGLEIAIETEKRDFGFGGYSVSGIMMLKGPDGSTGERKFKMYTMEVSDDGDKRLVNFLEPRDLAGMVSLTYSHGLKPDDQWIYMPALRRTKRLAARDKSGSFAGSELSFEDIGTWEVKKYTYNYIKDEILDGKPAFVVENTPAYPYSSYKMIKEWVDQEIYRPLRLLYHDINGRPLKEMRFYDYKKFSDKYWRPMKMVMTNLKTGAVSTILWSDYQFDIDIKASDLNPAALRRWSR
ncbi:MAG: outer membrane lipoprotein-sorting protein [Gammaproteobacteria bacterium]|nr:outer membrane lipoprotein-sorting protein [Gammaproteobacteria bacterium]